MRVAVTGISGRFGALVARRLHRHHTVVGLDRRAFARAPADVQVHRIDIRRKRSEAIFRGGGFDAVVHLNLMHDLRASSAEHYAFNIQGTARVVEYCHKHGIKKLILMSSANVYGPRADNTQFLTEDAPLMGGERFSDIRSLIAVDMLGQSFFWKYPDLETVILRPVHIVGAVNNAPSNYLRLRRPWTLAGFDPMVQLIHEDDVARAIEEALRPGLRGVFNLPGCRPAPLSVLIEMARSRPRPIPHPLAEAMLERAWKLRLARFPAPELDHLRFVCMVDGQRASDVLGFAPAHDLDATMSHLRRTRLLMS